MSVDAQHAAAMREMWDEWWYDRFEIPNGIPDDARHFEIRIEDETFDGVLLDHVAPRTCDAFWEILPYSGDLVHCAWFGHAAFYLDRIELPGVTEGLLLENRSSALAPGDIIWDPYIREITLAYGRHARVNFPTTIHVDGRPHPNQACVFARIVGNLDGFAVMCKRVRYEGLKVMRMRRAD
ncbi:DUF3830 family protein [Pseudonocardia acaciae]|uniref:DUF3830 family protein n=1 Tax=Pseudonocardia acaciae TaxID=551276 RepID=UPI000490E267|nr:DUF3830 family protein [Pseudonocardia acaciae]